jgi:4-hydroxybenzoate polyprenyltransferase/phosphoserine phosphatase
MDISTSPDASKTPAATVWDLDGTLLATDTFVETLAAYLFRQPWRAPRILFWLLRGRAHCKGRLAAAIDPDVFQWPIRADVETLIKEAKNKGRPVVLATAAHRLVADSVAARLGYFDAVLASDGDINLKGRRKREAIREWMASAGHDTFSYAGDSSADLPIWADADEVIVVQPTAALRKRVERLGKPVFVIGKTTSLMDGLLAACRPYQWSKNALLFVPMLLAQKFDLTTIGHVVVAFIAFSACASAIYIWNDIGDLQFDRTHPKKSSRPFASGAVPISWGAACCVFLLIGAGLLGAFVLPPAFLLVAIMYLIANIGYTIWLKQLPIVDVMMLACMYALRLEAGAAAADVPLSSWTLTFALFFFMSLALAKRHAELRRISGEAGSKALGRGYVVDDIGLIEQAGISSGCVSVLVMALYMNSDQMRLLWGDGRLLWPICPLTLYWVTRLWLLARRGQLDEDPILFALRDRVSLGIFATISLFICIAIAYMGIAR